MTALAPRPGRQSRTIPAAPVRGARDPARRRPLSRTRPPHAHGARHARRRHRRAPLDGGLRDPHAAAHPAVARLPGRPVRPAHRRDRRRAAHPVLLAVQLAVPRRRTVRDHRQGAPAGPGVAVAARERPPRPGGRARAGGRRVHAARAASRPRRARSAAAAASRRCCRCCARCATRATPARSRSCTTPNAARTSHCAPRSRRSRRSTTTSGRARFVHTATDGHFDAAHLDAVAPGTTMPRSSCAARARSMDDVRARTWRRPGRTSRSSNSRPSSTRRRRRPATVQLRALRHQRGELRRHAARAGRGRRARSRIRLPHGHLLLVHADQDQRLHPQHPHRRDRQRPRHGDPVVHQRPCRRRRARPLGDNR